MKVSKVLVGFLAVSTIILSCSRNQDLVSNVTIDSPPPQTTKEEVSAFAAETANQIIKDVDKSDKGYIASTDVNVVDKKDVKVLDTNNDGKITKEEIAVTVKNEFDNAKKVSDANDTSVLLNQQYNGDIPSPPPISTSKLNDVRLYVDREEILPMINTALKGAQKSIQMDLFLLGGNIGLEIAETLVKKRNEGIDIKLTFDPNLGFSGPTQAEVYKVIQYLQKNKVDFRLYPLQLIPKVTDGFLKNKFQIDHNKNTVIDGFTFIIGGFNLFDVGVINRDIMLKIEGPTAKDASDLLNYEWLLSDKFTGKIPTKYVYVVKGASEGDTMVKIVKTSPNESTTKENLLNIINSAQKSVYLAVLEFSDMDVVDALIKASKRGVDVKVLMDKKDTNDKYAGGAPIPSFYPNIMPAVELFKNQVPVRWYEPRFKDQELHMKMCVVDGQKLIAGSTNFTRQAFTTFRETSVLVEGGTAPDKMVRTFIEDWVNHSISIKKITLKDKISSKVVGFLDKKYYAWW